MARLHPLSRSRRRIPSCKSRCIIDLWVIERLVERELGHNPFSGALYAFTNCQRNKIKCLMWEDNGFMLYYKALAEEHFKWPGLADDVMPLTGEQINWLLDGYDITLMGAIKRYIMAVSDGR